MKIYECKDRFFFNLDDALNYAEHIVKTTGGREVFRNENFTFDGTTTKCIVRIICDNTVVDVIERKVE